jgi:membrane-associated phospholipid phosphatase
MAEWLESLVPWGTEVIVAFQSWSNPWLARLSEYLTYLGEEQFWLVAFPFVYWCAHRRVGIALAYLSLLSTWFVHVLKFTFDIPRPADPRVHVPLPKDTPSFPSAHAQGAIVNWGYLGYRFRSRAFRGLVIFLIPGISLSRIVLGVHYPQDVIGGFLIGLVMLVLYVAAAPMVSRWVEGQTAALHLTLAVLVPGALVFAHPAGAADQYPAKEAVAFMSALAGFGAGLVMERAWIRWRMECAWWRRMLRLPVGLVVLLVLYLGPSHIVPAGAAYSVETLIRVARYGLLGWSTAFLCPWIFVRLGLAEQEALEVGSR